MEQRKRAQGNYKEGAEVLSKPKERGGGKKAVKLFVGGLPGGTYNQDLKQHFNQYTKVSSSFVVHHNKKPCGFGFLYVEDMNTAMKVLAVKHQIKGVDVDVRLAVDKSVAKVQSEELLNRKVFVGGLPKNFTDKKLYEFFSQFGALEKCYVVKDSISGQTRGFGFLFYETNSGSINAVNHGPYLIEGKTVHVKSAVAKTASESHPHDEAAYEYASNHFSKAPQQNWISVPRPSLPRKQIANSEEDEKPSPRQDLEEYFEDEKEILHPDNGGDAQQQAPSEEVHKKKPLGKPDFETEVSKNKVEKFKITKVQAKMIKTILEELESSQSYVSDNHSVRNEQMDASMCISDCEDMGRLVVKELNVMLGDMMGGADSSANSYEVEGERGKELQYIATEIEYYSQKYKILTLANSDPKSNSETAEGKSADMSSALRNLSAPLSNLPTLAGPTFLPEFYPTSICGDVKDAMIKIVLNSLKISRLKRDRSSLPNPPAPSLPRPPPEFPNGS